MYIGALVVTLAACPYLFQLEWLSQSCATAVCVWSRFISTLRSRCRKISNNGTLSNFYCETQQIYHRDICFFNRSLWRCHSIDNYVFKWHKAFKEDQENVEDDPLSGRPISSISDQNVEVVRAVLVKDRRLSVRMIAEQMGLDKNAVYRILTHHLHKQKKIVQNSCLKTCL